jgi:AcrR family transcriptional regulator
MTDRDLQMLEAEANGTPVYGHGERVRQSILTAGVRLWAAGIEPSARRIGAEVQLTHAGVLHHFVTSERLKNAVAAHAVQMQESRVIVQLIGIGHAAVQGLSDAERLGHLNRAR